MKSHSKHPNPRATKKQQDLDVLDSIVGHTEKHMMKPFQKAGAPAPEASEAPEDPHAGMSDSDLDDLMNAHKKFGSK